MTTPAEFFLARTSRVIQYETLEMSHPNFSQTFYLVRNATEGLTARLENLTIATFVYVPMRLEPLGLATDLDFGVRVTLGDLGEIIPAELDAVAAAGTFGTKPTIKYRTYASDDLTAPMLGPYTLEVREFSMTQEGAAFECRPKSLNTKRTGVPYFEAYFPTLRGLL